MHSAGTRPDVVAYTTAIKICAENKCLKLAFSLFEEMRRYQIKPNWVILLLEFALFLFVPFSY
jgi:pentatricopeptide repeat protein